MNNFATHSFPIDKNALYVVYRPNMGYQNDYRFERCEEYQNISAAIKGVDKELEKINQEYRLFLSEFNGKPQTEEVTQLINFRNDILQSTKEPLIKRRAWLIHQAKEIREKYGIVRKYSGEASFERILIEELYCTIDDDKFKAAVRRAKERLHNLLDEKEQKDA